MKVFVSGATGVLGAAVIERLRSRDDDIVALAHSDAAGRKLQAMGIASRRADVTGRDDMTKTVAGCDAILHLATRIPAGTNMLNMSAWEENHRIRELGCERLVRAAKGAGIETIVFPSIVLVYPDSGVNWIDANTTRPSVTAFMRATLNAERSIEQFGEQDGRGIVLRMGQFYGRDRMTKDMISMARKGWTLLFGPGDAYISWIWIEDAADAIVAAMDPKVRSGSYDIVDDDPVTRDQIVRTLEGLARKKIRRVPTWPFKLMGAGITKILAGSRRVSNRRWKDATGWSPRVSTLGDGLQRVAAAKPTR